jgi:uncharacterized membrane protein
MMKKWLNSDILLAGSLFGLAAVLRIFFLSDRYLDIDEAFQIYIAGQPTIGSFFEAMFALGPQQHPLDYVIDFIFFRFIQDAFYLRLLKVFWGCATVVLLYFLGKTLHGKRFGLLWAFLLAISVLHINYSQTIRHYALVTLLSVFSVLSFVRFDTNRTWKISYATAMVLLQLTYPFLIVMGLAEYLFIRWENGEKSRQLLYALIPSWIVALLWEGWSFFSYWTESPQTSLYSPMSFLKSAKMMVQLYLYTLLFFLPDFFYL